MLRPLPLEMLSATLDPAGAPPRTSDETRAVPPVTGDGERSAREPLLFDDVYEECVAFVWRSLKSLGVRDHRLDDAVQEVFLVVHRRLGEFESRSSVRTWVYGIAVRIARDCRRREHRKGGLSPLDVETADPRPGPDEQVELSRAMDELAAILDTLDPDKRDIFVLSEVEQLSAPEIAQAIGVNVNTVYSRIRAARKEFEIAFSQHEERRR